MRDKINLSQCESILQDKVEQASGIKAVGQTEKQAALEGDEDSQPNGELCPARTGRSWSRVTFYFVIFAVVFGFSFMIHSANKLGYMPKQPLLSNHALHAGELKLDCRYCHNTVETARRAAIPSTEVCVSCHREIGPDNRYLILFESFSFGKPLEWIRIHRLPDYVFFHHGAHAAAGIGCESCHGRVDLMREVSQVETMTMKWCLDCHRNPAGRLRPRDRVTQMNWSGSGGILPENLPVVLPSTDCSTCHR